MANILIQSPFEYLTDRNGRALANGKIYIGEPDKDPENFPVAAFFDVDGTIPAPQPIRTNSAGFPCDASGNPQRIYTSANYSIRVSDQNGAQIVYAANSADGLYGVIASDLANQADPDLGSGMVGWVYAAGADGDTLHDKIKRGWVDVKDFGAVGDGLANDKAAFDAAASTGRTILLTSGAYNVPSGDYSSVRFYSFDGATTNNGTIAVVDPLSSSVPVGVEAFFSCDDTALPFGWLALNGNVLNRLVYPQLWAYAEGSGNIVNEVNKTTNPAAFGRGDGTSTFSLPDKRGTVPGYQDDGASVDASFVLGKRIEKTAQSGAGTSIKSSIGTWAIRAFAQAVNEGTIDIAALQAQVAAQQTQLVALQPQLSTAWVNFNGTGTVAIRDSYNVSSITDNGTGDYTVNFATAMANANYAVAIGATIGVAGNFMIAGIKSASLGGAPVGKTTGGVSVVSVTSSAVDNADFNVVIFGGK